MISPRLKSLVQYINAEDNVIDIGCDHALLGIYLIKNNVLNKIVVSDNKETALNSGIKNIREYNLSEYIDARLGDGLQAMDESINTAIISGMGSHSIVGILSNEKIKHLNKLIIQSNNDYFYLRKNVVNMGFYIKNESIVKDNNHSYINILFVRGFKKYSLKELKYGPILMNNAADYYKELLEKEEYILKNIPFKRIITRIKKRKEVILLRRLIK